jgi:arylsulfatase A-like enzyme
MMMRRAAWSLLLLTLPACSAPPPRPAGARNLLLVTIDTLRADHVGAYGYDRARTPALDELARQGVRFDRAYAAAPITLPSHATMLTGRYPPGHGSRHNLDPIDPAVPTLPAILRARGFATAAFIAAFPLDHRFGLSRGFDVYGDRMPRDLTGRLLNERPGRAVVDEAIAWLQRTTGAAGPRRFFLWVHLFEPHAPYGDPRTAPGRSAVDRYDDEIAIADAQAGRLIQAVRSAAPDTAIVFASDHGEGLGEHGEPTHSLFLYDTTLRVPLVVAGPAVPRGVVVADRACLVDVMPTAMALLGLPGSDTDGVDLTRAFGGARLADRELYAESFAPLFDFGWSPLRSVRRSQWKFIAAPRPELFDVDRDPAESRDLAGSDAREANLLGSRVDRYSSADLPAARRGVDPESAGRLRALGYVGGGSAEAPAASRLDPKDRREVAARFAAIASDELSGVALREALEAILREDPGNPQANLRLGWALLDADRPREAEPRFAAALAGHVFSSDLYLGLAACQTARGDLAGALRTLGEVAPSDRDDSIVLANIGVVRLQIGQVGPAIDALGRAVTLDPDFHEARFNLARAYARAGRFDAAEREGAALLARLPADAPQRAEVARLVAAVRAASARRSSRAATRPPA